MNADGATCHNWPACMQWKTPSHAAVNPACLLRRDNQLVLTISTRTRSASLPSGDIDEDDDSNPRDALHPLHRQHSVIRIRHKAAG